MQERGMGGWSATIILALIGFFNIFGTLGMGYLGTKYKKKIFMYFYALRASICIFIFSPPSIINSTFWNYIWTFMALNSAPDKWNCCSNFWYKIFKYFIWNCFFMSSVWCFCWCVPWWLFFWQLWELWLCMVYGYNLINICNNCSFPDWWEKNRSCG